MIKEVIGNATLYCGDSNEILDSVDAVDSCVTDPPYGLSFMGKQWDYDVPNKELWRKVANSLKSGGHLLSFFGSRTYHRGVIPIEDAGFEIRDQLMWIYGSGFPKSHNIGKAVDKIGGKSLKWFVDYVISYAEIKGISKNDLTMLFPSKNGNPTGWLWNKASGTQGLTVEQFNKIKNFLELPFQTLEECEREIIGKKQSGLGSGKTYAFTENNMNAEKEIDITKGTSEYEGWGTALKPAHEPIVMARKPFKGSVAENVLEHGTGGINIDGCRVGNEGYTIGGKNKSVAFGSDMEKQERCDGSLGRFPANVMHDGSDVVLEIFPQTGKSSGGSGISSQKSATGEIYGEYKQGHKSQNLGGLGDEGTASRYFYCAKASKDDRDEGLEQQEAPTENLQGLDTRGRTLVREDGSKTLVERWKPNQTRKNTHPTVKPVELMKYLCRLVTPQGGVVLDPFMGSGSTGVAAMKEGFKFVGIELDRDYFDMACARIEEAQHNIQQDLF